MSSASPMATADHQEQEASGSDPQSDHFPFLHFTRELRELVYKELLNGHVASPPSFSDIFSGIRADAYGSRCNQIMCEHLPAAHFSVPSLLMNKQVRSEVLEVRTRPLTYSLDCVVAGGLGHKGVLYPTWLYVPFPSSRVDVVKVNFRIYGNLFMDWVLSSGVGELVWNLLMLLHRFLTRGADFLSGQDKGTGGKIGVLVLNVVKPGHGVHGGSAAPGGGEGDSWSVFEKVADCVDKGHWMMYQNWEAFELVRERVEVIRICLDGRARIVYDVLYTKVSERL